MGSSSQRDAVPRPTNAASDIETRKLIDKAVECVYPALVRIHVVTVEPSGGRLRKYEGGGSGVIISPKGHVITNHHVAGKARRLVCRMPDGDEIDAELVGTDALADISVIKLNADQVKARAAPLPVAVFGDSDAVRIADTVLAMGSPVTLSQSVTMGIVSNKAMILPELFWPFKFELDGEEVGTLVRWIGHDAPIYPGNSGGPLVNLEGEIIGINEVGIGLGGAIPSNLAKSVAEQLIASGTVARSWTGLECQPRMKHHMPGKGVLVGGIIEDSPAEKAGIQPGDIILEFDGVAVDAGIREDLPVFNRLVLSTPIGESVNLTVSRNGQAMSFSLITVPRDRVQGKDEELTSWGITARDLTLMSALELKRPNQVGVIVHSVRPGGPCSDAKPPLQSEDIILQVDGKPITNIADLRAITKAATEDAPSRVPVLVGFERQQQKMMSAVSIGKEPPEESPFLSQKAWLPVATQVLTRDLAELLGIDNGAGVRVTQVYKGHSAENAGLHVGDILLKVNGEPIRAFEPAHSEVLPNMIRQHKIGSQVTLDVLRDGESMRITVELEPPPKPPAEMKRYVDDNFEMTVRGLSFDDRVSMQIDEGVKGVLIERVEYAGWAALAHVALGDILISIDGTPTPDTNTVETILEQAAANRVKRVTFFVKRGIHTMYLEVEPNWEEQ